MGILGPHRRALLEEAGLLMAYTISLEVAFKWVGRVHGKALILKDGTDTRPAHSMGPHWYFFV